jgi:hypothetical protein
MTRPLAIDLFCGLGGWTDGLIAEGYDVIGFDIEQHEYGEHRYAGQLVIQDVRTLHGSQFRNASLIVASPPCQAYSYRAMPWKKAKALPSPDNTLFESCFRIQREACEAAGRHIPLIVENVRGAQPWVGRARWNYGSFYLWGDVPALMPSTFRAQKFNPDGTSHGQGSWFAIADSKNRGGQKVPMPPGGDSLRVGFQQTAKLQMQTGFKSQGMNWSDQTKRGQDFTRIAGNQAMEGIKAVQDGLGGYGGNFGWDDSPTRRGNSKSKGRKFASAMIAKIPLPLSRYIAATFRPRA